MALRCSCPTALARDGRRCVRGSPTPPGKCVFPAECTRRTRTLPRVRSAVVLPTVGDPRRIRSLQPVQPAVLLLTAGHSRRTHSLLSVQPVVLFTCGGRVLFTLSALRAHTKAAYKTDLHREMLRALKRPRGPGQGRPPVRFISSLFDASICT